MTIIASSTRGTVTLPATRAGGIVAPLHTLLTVAFLLFTLIGTRPFEDTSVASRTDGNILDRIAVMGMFGLALVILSARWRITWRTVVRNLPLFMLAAFCLGSVAWSDYPALTLRRGLLLCLLTTIAMAVAVGSDDLARMHRILFATLAAVIVINLLGTVLMPYRAISDIDVRGLYTQKNVAGIVAMVTIIVGVGYLISAQSNSRRLYALAVIALAAVFLVLTRSKTSLNITLIGVFIVVIASLIERWGHGFILVCAIAAIMLGIAIAIWLASLDFDTRAAMEAIVGDTSFSGRDELWAFARRDADRRFWLGHGYGAFWDVGRGSDPLLRAEVGSWLASVEIGVINQAHHGYLELWLNVGWPATVAATVLVIGYSVYGGLQAVAGSAPKAVRVVTGGLAVLLAMHLLHNFTEATLMTRGSLFWNLITLALFWISRGPEYAIAAQSKSWSSGRRA